MQRYPTVRMSPVFRLSAAVEESSEAGQSEPMVEITNDAIDFTQLTNSVRSSRAGAVVLFLGTVRDLTGTAQTDSLDYQAHESMAVKSMQKLEDQAREKWPVEGIAIMHRVGHLEPGEISVAVAVSSPHRQEAFDAGRWLIDTLKETVPIWKKENRPDGSTDWVHPGVPDGKSPLKTLPPGVST